MKEREEGQKPIQFCLKLHQEEDLALLTVEPLLAHRVQRKLLQ